MARGAPIHSQALVLNRTKFAETDHIVTLLLENGTLARAVAKGARRPGSRFAAPTELYSLIDALLAPGRSLFILTDAKRLETPSTQEESLEALSALSAFAETLLRAFPEGEEAPYLFGLAKATFEVLKKPQDLAHELVLCSAGILKALSYLGWKPELASCVECGSSEVSALSVGMGGTVCSECLETVPDAQPADGRRIAWLRALLALRLQELAQAPIDDAMARSLALFTKRWASYHLDSPLKAFDFLLML